uniref:Guanylate cyclase domain-containing protein n=1 Tax=Macrostomum lignano TaxID=282301 RepID=A0A1I8HQM1_9PLAT
SLSGPEAGSEHAQTKVDATLSTSSASLAQIVAKLFVEHIAHGHVLEHALQFASELAAALGFELGDHGLLSVIGRGLIQYEPLSQVAEQHHAFVQQRLDFVIGSGAARATTKLLVDEQRQRVHAQLAQHITGVLDLAARNGLTPALPSNHLQQGIAQVLAHNRMPNNLLFEDGQAHIVHGRQVLLVNVHPIHVHENVANHHHSSLVVFPQRVQRGQKDIINAGQNVVFNFSHVLGDHVSDISLLRCTILRDFLRRCATSSAAMQLPALPHDLRCFAPLRTVSLHATPCRDLAVVYFKGMQCIGIVRGQACDGHESTLGQMDLVQEGGGTAISTVSKLASDPIPSRPDSWLRDIYAPTTASHTDLASPTADLPRVSSGSSLTVPSQSTVPACSAAPGIDQLVLMQSDESFRCLFRPSPVSPTIPEEASGAAAAAASASWLAGRRFDEEEFANHRQREYPHTPQPLRPIEPRALRKIRRRIERADEARRLAKHAGTGARLEEAAAEEAVDEEKRQPVERLEGDAEDCDDRTGSVASGDSGAASCSPMLHRDSVASEDLGLADLSGLPEATKNGSSATLSRKSSSTAVPQLQDESLASDGPEQQQSKAAVMDSDWETGPETMEPTASASVVKFFVGGDGFSSDTESASEVQHQQHHHRRRASSQQHQQRSDCYTPLDLARRTFSGNEILMEEFFLDPEEASQLGELDQDNVKSHRFDDLHAMRRHKISPALACSASVQRCFSSAGGTSRPADAHGFGCRSEPALLTPASASSATVDSVQDTGDLRQQLSVEDEDFDEPGSPAPALPEHLEVGSLRLGVDIPPVLTTDVDADVEDNAESRFVNYLVNVCRQEPLLSSAQATLDSPGTVAEALKLLGNRSFVRRGPATPITASEAILVLVAENLPDLTSQQSVLLLCHLRSPMPWPTLTGSLPVRCLFLTSCRQVGRLFACLCGDAEFRRQLRDIDQQMQQPQLARLAGRRRPRRELVQSLHAFLDSAVLMPSPPAVWPSEAVAELIAVEQMPTAVELLDCSSSMDKASQTKPVGLLTDIQRICRKSTTDNTTADRSIRQLGKWQLVKLLSLFSICLLVWSAAGASVFAPLAGYRRGIGAGLAVLTAGLAQLLVSVLFPPGCYGNRLAIVLGPSSAALTIEAAIASLAVGLGQNWTTFRPLCCFYCAIWSAGCLLLAPSNCLYSITAVPSALLGGFTGMLLLSWTIGSLDSPAVSLVCFAVVALATQLRHSCRQFDLIDASVRKLLGKLVAWTVAMVTVLIIATIVGMPETDAIVAVNNDTGNYSSSHTTSNRSSSLVWLPWQPLLTGSGAVSHAGIAGHAGAVFAGAGAAVLLLVESAVCWLRRLSADSESTSVRIGGLHLALSLTGVAMPLLCGLIGWPLIGSVAEFTLAANLVAQKQPPQPSCFLSLLLGCLLTLAGVAVLALVFCFSLATTSSFNFALLASLRGLVALVGLAGLGLSVRALLQPIKKRKTISRHQKSAVIIYSVLLSTMLAVLAAAAIASSCLAYSHSSWSNTHVTASSSSSEGALLIAVGCLLSGAPVLTVFVYIGIRRFCQRQPACVKFNKQLTKLDPLLCRHAALAASASTTEPPTTSTVNRRQADTDDGAAASGAASSGSRCPRQQGARKRPRRKSYNSKVDTEGEEAVAFL